MKRVNTRYFRISDSSCRLTPKSWNPREYKIIYVNRNKHQ